MSNVDNENITTTSQFQDLNGYHENIIVALKTAAAQRASAGAAGGSGDLRALQEYEYKRERAPSAEKIHEAELRRQRGKLLTTEYDMVYVAFRQPA